MAKGSLLFIELEFCGGRKRALSQLKWIVVAVMIVAMVVHIGKIENALLWCRVKMVV